MDSYNGGKGNLFRQHINLIPPHDVFVSAFAGHCAVTRHKRLAKRTVLIDKDEAVIDEWERYWLDEREDFEGVVCVGERVAAVAAINGVDGQLMPPEMAALPCGAATNGGALRHASPQMATSTTDAGNVVELVHGDSLRWLGLQDKSGSCCVYADLPYLGSTRSSDYPLYRHELRSEEEHEQALMVLLGLDCMVMVCGYWSELYADMLSGWRVASFDAWTRSNRHVIEYVWMNFPEPRRLHDYKWLGDDRREREKLKKRKRRWVNRLKGMPALERYAMLAAIEEAGL